MNGVTGSVLHVLRHLQRAGHEALVIAPRGDGAVHAVDLAGAEAALLRALPLPSYPDVRIAVPRAARITALLRQFRPDVVHLASPFVLGWQALAAADALRIPVVAVYQTDVISYAQRYGVPGGAALAAGHTTRLHRRATLTLAPSAASVRQLEGLGVDRLRAWGRGVDAERFAPMHRDESWRARIAPGEKIIGYVGRLAPEKQVADLRAVADIPGTRLVIVGDGPDRAPLQRALPDAVFTGHLGGADLGRALASFDVFVHPGESETFGQTLQEALASGVPVVATGTGGPVDLVRSSIDGWLYRPGELAELRERVVDLIGDEAKRRAFSAAARESVRARTWEVLCSRLVEHYAEARMLRPIDDALMVRAGRRPEAPGAADPVAGRWRRYVALGDSVTEGLCDTSRMPPGEFRGWADRLAQILGQAAPVGTGFEYANLAVRSRRIHHLLADQLPAALALRPDLVSVLIGANDLVGPRARPIPLAHAVETAVKTLRAAGCDVLLVTPFLPRRRAARVLGRRFAVFNSELRSIARRHGAILLDLEALPAVGALDLWAPDAVHLRSQGHRFVAYKAAEALGIPDAGAIGALDAALHVDEEEGDEGEDDIVRGWLRRDALPWLWRRMRGRTAGDGRSPKHETYVQLVPATGRSTRKETPRG